MDSEEYAKEFINDVEQLLNDPQVSKTIVDYLSHWGGNRFNILSGRVTFTYNDVRVEGILNVKADAVELTKVIIKMIEHPEGFDKKVESGIF